MEKIIEKSDSQSVKEIPNYLIYEILDGKPIYYKGYDEVLNGQKTAEDIMGSSALQFIIISLILKELYINLSDADYLIGTNEVGLHLGKNLNPSSDIVIYDKIRKAKLVFDDRYTQIAPNIVIEVDTKADSKNFENPLDYYFSKTQNLLDFGVEKVVWFISKSQKVTLATAQNWQVFSWTNPIEIVPNFSLCLSDLLHKQGISLEQKQEN